MLAALLSCSPGRVTLEIETALDESREQYLKKAESIVADYRTRAGASLAQTFAALEILTLVAE